MKEETQLIENLVDYYRKQLTLEIIEKMKTMRSKHVLLAGEDSGLENNWEEFCVQVQGEHSFYYSAYEEMVYEIARQKFISLSHEIQDLLNYAGRLEEEDCGGFEGVDLIVQDVSSEAMNYENQRIKRALYSELEEEEEMEEEEEDEDTMMY